MFTGIIKEIGKVAEVKKNNKLISLAVESKNIFNNANPGDSIAVNGVCLTVTRKDKNVMFFEAVTETMRRTSISGLSKGDIVNLEDSLRAGDPLGGHFVLGHIDCIGIINSVSKEGEDVSIEVSIPSQYDEMIVEKGSISIDGVSLTIGSIKDNKFKVYVIPHTLKTTTLSSKGAEDKVNLEFDILGKYIARSGEIKKKSGITDTFLKENGF